MTTTISIQEGTKSRFEEDAPVHSIVPLSSVIYFDIIVEAEKEDDGDDNKKKQRDKMFY